MTLRLRLHGAGTRRHAIPAGRAPARADGPAFVDACKAAAKALGAKDELTHYYPRYPPITPKQEQLLAGS